MELCSNKTLADVVKQRGGLSEREVACYAREIVAAVAHLHANRVIHRDLKLGNLFLTPAGLDEAGAGPGSDPDLEEPAAGGRLKIGDFGLACRLDRDDERKTTICGTPNYIAPEVLAGSKGGGHSYEVDVWSIGVILYTLFVGTPPFQTSDVHATYKRIRANAYAFPDAPRVSERAKALIRSCLAPKPTDRPKIWDVAAHELLRVGREDWDFPKKGPRVSPEEARAGPRATESSAPHPERVFDSDRRRRAEKAAALLAEAERATAERATAPAIGVTPIPPARKSSTSPGSANRARPTRDASVGGTTAARAPLSPLPANRATKMNADVGSKSATRSAPRVSATREPPPTAAATFTVLDGVLADAPKPRRAAEEARRAPFTPRRRARRGPFIPRTRHLNRHLNRHPGRIRRGRLLRRRRRVASRRRGRAPPSTRESPPRFRVRHWVGCRMECRVECRILGPRLGPRRRWTAETRRRRPRRPTGRRNDPRRRGRYLPPPLPRHPSPLPRHPTARLRRSSATPSPRSSTRWRLDGAARRVRRPPRSPPSPRDRPLRRSSRSLLFG